MAVNPFDLLVQIFVPTDQEPHGVTATGYPVAPDLILTARHSLFPKNRDTNREIEARFYYIPERKWLQAKIVWDGGSQLDCALVRVGFPPGARSIGFLSLAPAVKGDWQGMGFARAGQREQGDSPAIGLSGKIQPSASGEPLDLGVDYPVDDPEKWRGASGAPVFLEGRIVGVIQSCLPHFAGGRLMATPVCDLAKDAGFGKIFPLDQAEKLQRVIVRAANVLSTARAATETLESLLDEGAIPGKDLPSKAYGVSSRLANEPPESLVKFFDRAHTRLCERKPLSLEDLRAVVAVANILIPIVFDAAVVVAARSQVRSGVALIGLPAATKTVAEVIMAAADRRRLSFRPLKTTRRDGPGGFQRGLDPPTSNWDISSEPEVGIDFSGSNLADEIHRVLAAQFLSSEELEKWTDPQARRLLVRQRLEIIQKDPENGGTYYLIFEKNRHAPKADSNAAVQSLKDAYPALAIIELRDDDLNLKSREDHLVWPISQILWRHTAKGRQDANHEAN